VQLIVPLEKASNVEVLPNPQKPKDQYVKLSTNDGHEVRSRSSVCLALFCSALFCSEESVKDLQIYPSGCLVPFFLAI
jgi:hypothetical protein